jgi:hypothetical protein
VSEGASWSAGRIESAFAVVVPTYWTFSFALIADPGRSAESGERKVVMPRSLPEDPSVRFLQLEAKDVIKAHKSGDVTCCATLRYHFRFSRADDDEILKAQVTLQEAQHALSLDYGFKSWTDLTERAIALSETDRRAGVSVSSERARAKEQAQVLESIGTLAGGVAHEFSSALMGITSNITPLFQAMNLTHKELGFNSGI